MYTYTIKRSLWALLLLACTLVACEDFLEEKPDGKLAVPSSLEDLQALLDYVNVLNYNSPAGSSETSADDYYLTTDAWAALFNEGEQRKYTWAEDNLFHIDYYPNDWYSAYERVYYANTVLEGLQRLARTPANAAAWDQVKGQALYHRAQALLNAAFVWTVAYDEATAATDLGLPLRLSTDFGGRSVRASLQETYGQILQDLEQATALLPVTARHVMRPSAPAAHALLARTLLVMGRYAEAGAQADRSLQLYDRLLDYNTLDSAVSFPFPPFNPEVLQESQISTPEPLYISTARVDSTLYRLYAPDDLRKALFFQENADGSQAYRGSYEGNPTLFAGVATDEVYLIQAETLARAGDVTGALERLNTLLRYRWRTGTFVELTAATPDEALALVLQERRKELLMRGLRWMDIKRLNREGAGITLRRVLDGRAYVLPPGDPRFALPLPEEVIELSGMTQNPR
ncbi:RagB/SusD family nutrient uptake outer membrane protein [Pontibacter rugosus]|uniref:RagB/SusD family nutrient uptake outer membrane protein n=1 Tax=Pontibacter rugosus TaxID=1745966 RepID=A0ABW3SKB9_9BACT